MGFADKSWTVERSFKFHRCSRNIAGNSRKSAELINSIIIGPILRNKIMGFKLFNQLRGLASAGASIPQCHLPQNRNSHVFAEFTHSPIFTKITFSVYFSSPYFYHDTFMLHSLHVLCFSGRCRNLEFTITIIYDWDVAYSRQILAMSAVLRSSIRFICSVKRRRAKSLHLTCTGVVSYKLCHKAMW